MISIRRIYDHNIPANQRALARCKEILVAQFPYLTETEVDEVFAVAKNPLAAHFRYAILVAEARNKDAIGLAVASYFPKENFYFLDYLAAHKHRSGSGVGGALYERLREEAVAVKAAGIFFDCLPDTPELCLDEEDRKQNTARLRFYERYGARPIEGTLYELPRSDKSVFHLVFEGPDEQSELKSSSGKRIIRAILEHKLSAKCSPDYIQKVVDSVKGPTLQLRTTRHARKEKYIEIAKTIPRDKQIVLVVNEGHTIHHVKDRGYLESPVRIDSILSELNKAPIFSRIPARRFSDKHLESVHEKKYLNFLKQICKSIGNSDTKYGDVFPIRNAARLPADFELQIGYYCIDTSTPLNANAYIAARAAVDCALTAADELQNGRHLGYALVRPPGHHAERRHFGGFCYFNSNAVAAHYLSKTGKVAILDIDYHHGNGQQNIFYERSDVLTVSIHADPEHAYPYFTGFRDEQGKGIGEGYNLNLPLKTGIDGKVFRRTLVTAIAEIKKFNPTYLIVALGLDTASGDPTGTWKLSSLDFAETGKLLAKIELPTLIVQEGGYKRRDLGINARHFFEGLWQGFYG